MAERGQCNSLENLQTEILHVYSDHCLFVIGLSNINIYILDEFHHIQTLIIFEDVKFHAMFFFFFFIDRLSNYRDNKHKPS